MTRVKLENFDRIVDLVCSSTQQVSSIVQESTHKINASQEDLLINVSFIIHAKSAEMHIDVISVISVINISLFFFLCIHQHL